MSPHLVWHFLQAVQSPDMIQRVYGRREAAVETEYLFQDTHKKKRAMGLVRVATGRVIPERSRGQPVITHVPN